MVTNDHRSTPSTGFIEALRTLGSNLFASVEDRLKLVSLELQEEKFRLIQTFIWISAVLFSSLLAITFASFTLVYFFWETARLAVLCGLSAFYTSTTIALILVLRRFLASQPEPFVATLQEIGSDRACIRNPN
jgi:uncharacterized membrane protein YqjE